MNWRRVLPHPLLTITLFLVWQALSDGVSGGSLVLGAILGVLIPRLTGDFWPDSPGVRHPWRFAVYVVRVLWDILVASLSVARLILTPGRRPKPAFVCYPLTLEHPLAITALASTISLTPGTVSTDVSDDHRLLLIHALDVEDEQDLIDTVRRRYEQPLQEIFQ